MTDKIRVLHTIRQGKIGGGETHVINLIEQLDQNHFESLLLAFTDGPMVDKMRARGIKTFVVKTEKPFNFTKWSDVEKIIKENKIDIVHAHGTRANSNSFYAAKKFNIPLVYTVHGWSFHPDQSFIIKKIRLISESQLIKRSDLTICVSNNNLLDGRSHFNIERATVIRSGIDLEKYNFNSGLSELRKEFHIDETNIVVGYIVRITKQKDPFTLVRAIKLIPENLNLKFLFVGEGDLKEDTIALAKQLKVYHRIIFQDFREDVPDVLRTIDIYSLPSLWEGLPIGLLEAMAMKKAVIATAIDGTKEVIEHMQNGILVPVSCPQALADAIIMLANDHKLRKSLGENALKTIEKEYNNERMTKQIEDIYYKLSQGRDPLGK
ncbi:glycosyl transferase [Pedobacter quisquiliarum]|uniref:Glycosyl transferase n=1 Tax=Pedobacter quisquiliarum TaxID=1834438 RepID=A0A916XGA3_9SPHI|nr:glycosyltransferase family 4 protein [Pedobacter quisquiliarum]GGC71368.1 glycosyl transferase [Pedobacter quisquiliarum]